MSNINLSGNASGSGTFTIASPNSNTSYTLALPEEAGTITTSNSPYSTFRNRIINGDMRIAQRGTGAFTASGDYPVDRFLVFNSTDGAFSAQQNSSAPVGFINSLKYTATTADATLTTTQNTTVRQFIEGTNVSDLAWGTANAKTVTLSFWVRSSLTGTFGGAFRNGDADRNYPFTYSISVADIWEYKTVTIAGDTSGTWLTTTGIGIGITFSMGAGPDRSGTAGAWAAGNIVSATGATSVIGTLNATWYVTGVQLEVGSVATPFERRPFGTELSLCQRYFQTIGAITAIGNFYDSTQAIGVISYPVAMRATPTLSATGAITLTDTGANYTQSSAVFTSSSLDQYAAFVRFNNLTGTTAYRPYSYNYTNSSNRLLTFSAEL